VTVWAVVVAAGIASRFGRLKQFEQLGSRRVVDWSLEAARAVCDGVVLVVPPGAPLDEPAADAVVQGAATRSGSVRRGMTAVPDDANVIVVQDAARPLAGAGLYQAVVAVVRDGADGCICAVPVSDTLKRVEDGVVAHTVDRHSLWAVQTPQAFAPDALRRAHQGEPEATDDAALVEAIGGKVVVVEGDHRNLKLTRPGDLAVAEALLGTLR
jgi:2-C-methyl-D-erythritol 4-phosphate cytidylyltransferase